VANFTLDDLDRVIASRAQSDAAASYTKALLDAGAARTAKKLGEEAVEAVIAGVQGDKEALKAEAADVLYHLLVLLRVAEVPLSEVMSVLESRTAQSGHAEKASRSP
jgi:phosphoribosyl-ATP pyrophosphohydrolase